MRFVYLLLVFSLLPLSLAAQVRDEEEMENGFSFIFDSEHLGDKYLKVISTYTDENEYWVNNTIHVYQRSTNSILQTLDSVQTMGSVINVGDFNFDEYPDFSMFEQSYAGSNTSELYFLYNPQTDLFFLSNYLGTSLEFHNEKKLIYEHNTCCGGRYYNQATYKVVDNEMVLVEKHCYELNEDTPDEDGDFVHVEVACDE